MNFIYIVVAAILFVMEVLYFKIADHFNIIDKPNARSSHSSIVLRGGGVIVPIGVLGWFLCNGIYPGFVIGLLLVAVVSFVDDVRSLPDSVRLVAQFVAMGLMFWQLDMLHISLWWAVILGLVVCVGATNVINFMDGINGITGGYALAVLLPLLLMNRKMNFVDESFIIVVILAVLVFCWFNFRPKGKAKCFAGDVGSISVGFTLLFVIGQIVMQTGDVTWLILLLVYGVDGCLTICHRILLHENLGDAHRKHAYQLMANELGISHPLVSSIYMGLQLVVSLGFIYLCPDSVLAHWLYLGGAFVVLCGMYLIFMKKYYHLHEEYLAALNC